MPSPDERSVGDDDGDDFPLPEGSIPGRTTLPEPEIGSAKVPPRGGGVSSRKVASNFFSHRKTSYRRRWTSESHQGAHEVGGAPRGGHPREQGVGPLAFIFGDDFSLFILIHSVEFQDFWSCAE